MNPYAIIIAGALWIASVGTAYYYGGVHKENELNAKASQDASDAQGRAEAAAVENEKRKRERAERDRTRDEEVATYASTPTAAAECFDADGYELFNGAGSSAVPVPGGRPPVVPRQAAKGRR